MGAGAAAGAAAAGAHRRGHSNASGDLPQTPTSVPDAGEFHDAREAAGSSSGASFYSAGGGDGGSEASYASARSAGLSDAGASGRARAGCVPGKLGPAGWLVWCDTNTNLCASA
jgi:hypothetical protein